MPIKNGWPLFPASHFFIGSDALLRYRRSRFVARQTVSAHRPKCSPHSGQVASAPGAKSAPQAGQTAERAVSSKTASAVRSSWPERPVERKYSRSRIEPASFESATLTSNWRSGPPQPPRHSPASPVSSEGMRSLINSSCNGLRSLNFPPLMATSGSPGAISMERP